MNKVDLAKRLARLSHRSRGKAADAVDTLVHKLLKGLGPSSAAVPESDKKAPPAKRDAGAKKCA